MRCVENTYTLVCAAGFLELINNMLTSGMVPALYPDDEKEAIIGSVFALCLSSRHINAHECMY